MKELHELSRIRQPDAERKFQEVESQIANLIEAIKHHYVPELGDELEQLKIEKEHLLASLTQDRNSQVPDISVQEVRKRLAGIVGLLNRDSRRAREELIKIVPEIVVNPGKDGSYADGAVYLSVEGLVEAGCDSPPLVGAYNVGGGTRTRTGE